MQAITGVKCDICGEEIKPTDNEALIVNSCRLQDTGEDSHILKHVCGFCALNEEIWQLRSGELVK